MGELVRDHRFAVNYLYCRVLHQALRGDHAGSSDWESLCSLQTNICKSVRPTLHACDLRRFQLLQFELLSREPCRNSTLVQRFGRREAMLCYETKPPAPQPQACSS
jgi:hypothetical protein